MLIISLLCLFTFVSCDEEDYTSSITTPKEESPLKKEIKSTIGNYVDSLMNKTPTYIPYWNQEGYKGRWNYIDGVFLNSIVNLYKDTNDQKYKNFFLRYIDYYLNKNGSFINPETLEENFKTGELDTICESKILFDAYEMTQDRKYALAIEETFIHLNNITRAYGTSNFSHKEIYKNQIWLDGMYMYVPFYLRYANFKKLSYIYNEVKEQYKYIRDNMFSEEMKLYYHGHDTTKSIFWADKQTGNSKSFWLRSMGWYIVSLADSIEYVKNDDVKNYLISLLDEALNGILQYQDSKSKMFYQLIDKGNQSFNVKKEYLEGLKNTDYSVNDEYKDTQISNYLESSGSSMIAYALLKSSRLGYLQNNLFDKGVEIFEGIYNHSVSKVNGVHLNDICITAGLGPETNTIRDGSPAYYLAERVGSDDGKGVGPFIMAYLEYIR